VIGEPLDGAKLDAAYWCRNLREPVRFDRTLERIFDDGHGVVVEVSPHPVLTVPIASLVGDRELLNVSSLERDQGDLRFLMGRLAMLHVEGFRLDWRRLLEPLGGELVELPTYAFQREVYGEREEEEREEVGFILGDVSGGATTRIERRTSAAPPEFNGLNI